MFYLTMKLILEFVLPITHDSSLYQYIAAVPMFVHDCVYVYDAYVYHMCYDISYIFFILTFIEQLQSFEHCVDVFSLIIFLNLTTIL